MSFLEWSKSSVDYGRRLVDSAVEGARSRENDFLKEEPLAPYLGESVRLALAPAFIGACLGVVGGYLANGRRSTNRALASGLFGGAIGFGAGVVWESLQVWVSVAAGAWRTIGTARDHHGCAKNPIDYA